MRHFIRFSLVGVLLFCSETGWAQEYGDPSTRTVGAVAYPGNFSPAEVMAEEVERIRAADIDAEISFTVAIGAVKNDNARVQSLEGLPIEQPSPESSIDEVTVEVPFQASEFRDEETFDYEAFTQHIEKTLKPLRAADTAQKAQKHSTEGGALNQPNCGGYPLGTVVTVHTESCLLGNITNQYTCMENPTTGGRDWNLTSSQWFPPSDTECFGGGV